MSDSLEIIPVDHPIRGAMRPPGSKSLTNRALVVAALAQGTSTLSGVLDSDDTRVMLDSLRRLGLNVTHQTPPLTQGGDTGANPQSAIPNPQSADAQARIVGCAGRPPSRGAELWLENSGTSIRFLTALSTLGSGEFRLDGNARMRQRPIGDLADALNACGASVRCEHDDDCPPVIVHASGLPGGRVQICGEISSQYLSALLMAAPAARTAVTIELTGKLVSQPYVEMTRRVMEAFGVRVTSPAPGTYHIEPQTYSARDYAIEPDASAASYFFAAAAITGGEVTVTGLSRNALQGDVAFVEALRQMGCGVEYGDDQLTVRGGPLVGIDIDMNAISDTAQTLAAVAPFATGPTRIRNIAHVRHKETDRIAAVATELRRLGQTVEEFSDGLAITPAPIRPATISTYDDHRMAMSFALVGLRARGIRIADPGCTAKTYPGFFDDLRRFTGQFGT